MRRIGKNRYHISAEDLRTIKELESAALTFSIVLFLIAILGVLGFWSLYEFIQWSVRH